MALFEIPKRNAKSLDKQIAFKSQSLKISRPTIKGGNDILSRINRIKAEVEKNLGQFRDKYILIQDKDVLIDYVDNVLKNKYISIDTETDGLDPLQNILAGICIYTDGEKAAYTPLNHISYITGQKLNNQLESDFVLSQFKRITENKDVYIDMFNAKFDIRFLRAFGLNDIYCNWDGYLASRILNENEEHKNLKDLHNKYCLDGKGDAFRFDDLFRGIPFTYIPPNVGYLYAAHDPDITTELCRYQRKYLTDKTDREDIRKMYWVFKNIEMPCVNVVADMEDTGILFDLDYQKELSTKYNKLLVDAEAEALKCIDVYHKEIEEYRVAHPQNKLDEPINIGSPTQLATLLYDILNIASVDKKAPRGTGVEVLTKIDNPICKAILKYREINKLISTYIDKLPNCINPKDGRIHCSFNQYGADTGRMSSSEPNLQNIPSHNKDIRKMFVASDGYVLMSSDYSQQEPKCLAALCKKQGDSQMYDTFMQGKDLYSEIASKAFNKPYEECKEFREDGTTNKEGKERRTQAKGILLGVLYGRGEASIAEQLNVSIEEAKDIKNSVFKGFPAIKEFEQNSLNMAYELGYVTTVCGRKRRLPDLQLDEYEFKWKDGVAPDNDLLDFDTTDILTEVPKDKQNYYLKKLSRCWGKARKEILEEARREGIIIVDNCGKIADAQRQCVNARIQGRRSANCPYTSNLITQGVLD
jgi:DNA polymerase I-like protein with 3'-5' exonuclease and polymerase domains